MKIRNGFVTNSSSSSFVIALKENDDNGMTAIKNAIVEARAKGIKVGMIRPITLYPFPKASLNNLDYSKVKGIIDIEMTIPAQMRDDIELQVKGRCPVHEYGRSGGMLLDDEGVYEAISNIVKEGE